MLRNRDLRTDLGGIRLVLGWVVGSLCGPASEGQTFEDVAGSQIKRCRISEDVSEAFIWRRGGPIRIRPLPDSLLFGRFVAWGQVIYGDSAHLET